MTYSISDVKSWLSVALAKENLADFAVKFVGNSAKGDGYMCDIIFVDVTGINLYGTTKEYNLVVKCGKSTAELHQKAAELGPCYDREIFLYENVFPSFRKFQLERSVERPFNSVAKCYGVFNNKDKQIIVLENLRKNGYSVWDAKNPLTKSHVDLIIQEFAKFHAISVAMKMQEPDKFEVLRDGIKFDVFKECFDVGFVTVFETYVNEIYNLLQNHLDSDILEKWITFKEQINYIFSQMDIKNNELNVITHGDCWNNNFMFKYHDEEKSSLSRVAILDWQLATYTSPVLDLSYFLFSCISSEDIDNLNEILKNYHDTFIGYLGKLGTDFKNKYSFESFLKDWKQNGKFGVMMCLMAIKISNAEEEDIPDMAASAQKGGQLSDAFIFKVKNEDAYRSRIKPIVKYAVESGLI